MSADWTPENGKCFFGPHAEEGYARKAESGEYQPACFACASKPYPVPKQFQKADSAPEAVAA